MSIKLVIQEVRGLITQEVRNVLRSAASSSLKTLAGSLEGIAATTSVYLGDIAVQAIDGANIDAKLAKNVADFVSGKNAANLIGQEIRGINVGAGKKLVFSKVQGDENGVAIVVVKKNGATVSASELDIDVVIGDIANAEYDTKNEFASIQSKDSSYTKDKFNNDVVSQIDKDEVKALKGKKADLSGKDEALLLLSVFNLNDKNLTVDLDQLKEVASVVGKNEDVVLKEALEKVVGQKWDLEKAGDIDFVAAILLGEKRALTVDSGMF